MIGTTIDGRYAIESRLGEGGMGMVYKARHVLIDKPVAIKILRKEAAQDAASVQRFIQEAKSASKINHSNIVDITDFGVLPDGHAYFVMEFLQGQTLAQAILEGPMDPIRVCVIGAQMARGLHAAHQKGIVHRDLKPENIFLLEREGQQDVVKIVDFGIAKINGGQRLTQVGMVLGTPEYMSPEQATGAETDHRVDQYALGCIMYEMLTSVVPYLGERPAQTLTKHVFEALVPPCQRKPELNIPVSLEQIVVRTLAKKPAERYPSMRELELALGQLEGELRGNRSGIGPAAGAGGPGVSDPSSIYPSGYPSGDNFAAAQAYQHSYQQGQAQQAQQAYNGGVPYMPAYGGPSGQGMMQPGGMGVPLPAPMVSSGVVVTPYNNAGGYSAPMQSGWQPARAPNPTKESATVYRSRRRRTVLTVVLAALVVALVVGGAYYMTLRLRPPEPPPLPDPAPRPALIEKPLERGDQNAKIDKPELAVAPPKAEPKAERPPENISFTIDSIPQGAKIQLNGQVLGGFTPFTVLRPSGKPVGIELRRKGYQVLNATVTVDNDHRSYTGLLLASSSGHRNKGHGGHSPGPQGQAAPHSSAAPDDRYRSTPDPKSIKNPFGK